MRLRWLSVLALASCSSSPSTSDGGADAATDVAAPSDASQETGLPPGLANLWIDTNGGSCARSSTLVAYDDAAACASMKDAFDACQPGDVVVIKSATYGDQSVSGTKAAPGCTIIGEDATTIGAFDTSATQVTIRNVTVDVGAKHGAGWGNSGSNVTLENVRFHGPFVSVALSGGSNVTWRGGELGTAGTTGGKRSCNTGDSEPVQIEATDHVTIDGVTFHPQDFDPTPCSSSVNGFHLEMVRLDFGASYVTLENSTFDDGDHSNTASIFITNVNGDPNDPNHLLFQNDFFGTADNTTFGLHQNVQDCSTFTFAYNTFHNSPGDPTANGCTSSKAMTWVGNLGPWPAFYACAGTHTQNLWQDSQTFSCGSDKVTIGTRYGYDALGLGGTDGFHLQAGSPAIDSAETAGFCTTTLASLDHDGNARPAGAACDDGANEK